MTLTGVQLGRGGPWLKLGDRVRVKKTGKCGILVELNWNFHPRPGEGRHIVRIKFPNPCDEFADDDLFVEDIEFDPLEQMAKDAPRQH